jgi:hypothetical protein
MARRIRKTGEKQVPLVEIKDDDRLENDPRFLHRIEEARASLRAGRGIRLEDLNAE